MKGKERLWSEIRSVEDGRILDGDGLDWSLRLMRPSLDELLTWNPRSDNEYVLLPTTACTQAQVG